MALFSRHPRARWAAPVLAAALTVAGVATAQVSAGGQSDLAPRSAHDLLTSLQRATPVPSSGTVVQTMDLGLPDLGATGIGGAAGGAAPSPLTLLSGSHTWRTWYADPTHARLALVDGSTEVDVVRNGADVWQWSSTDQSVTHATVPAREPAPSGGTGALPDAAPGPTGLPDLTNPDAAATWALRQLDATTDVTSTTTDMVAGRPAYGLVLTPRTPATLIGSVHLSLDAATSLPLAVTVLPRGSTVPAVDVRYTTLTLAAPAASVFAFTPPPGATVTTPTTPGRPASGGGTAADATARPTLVGSGWSTVVVATAPATRPSTTGGANPLAALGAVLPRVSGSWGSGHLLRTRLLSAVLTTDGRVAVGAVEPAALYAALGH
jgi:outer membrane lipoprotein-sorting protein